MIDGAPSLWINEYYHLDGRVKITNRESGADYNIGLTPVTWQGVRNDLVNTRARAQPTIARPAVSIDPYAGDVPPGSPVALTAAAVGSSVVDLAWADCSNNERGFLVEASYGGVFGGKAYAVGELYTTAESMPANSTTVRLGTLNPSTRYFFRVKSFNAAATRSIPTWSS